MGLLGLLLILALIQGLTEFLPVSSSGHLVLGRSYLPGGERLPDDATVEILLHVGTLLAVCVFYRREILRLAAGALGRGPEPGTQRRLLGLLLLGSLPAGIVGIGFEEKIQESFGSPNLTSAMLLVTGAVLWWSRRFRDRGIELDAMGPAAALAIGCAQACAILPGISRSGSTIVIGLAVGLSAASSTTFSFLLSIIAVGGAILLEADAVLAFARAEPAQSAAGVATSALVGFLALGLLVWIGRNRRLWIFAPYCWAAGLAGLVWGLWLAD